VGLLLPWLALAVWSPFLAYFAVGGPITICGIASLALFGGAALLDHRELARLPMILEGMLADLDDALWRARPAPKEWSPVEIVCYLRESVRNIKPVLGHGGLVTAREGAPVWARCGEADDSPRDWGNPSLPLPVVRACP